MNQHYFNPAQNMEIKNHILSSKPIYYCDFLSIIFKTLSFLLHSFYVSVRHNFFCYYMQMEEGPKKLVLRVEKEEEEEEFRVILNRKVKYRCESLHEAIC